MDAVDDIKQRFNQLKPNGNFSQKPKFSSVLYYLIIQYFLKQ